MSAPFSDDYTGPAVVGAAELNADVRVAFAGRFEPVDGRYHWGGRIAPHLRLSELVRGGQRSATVQIGQYPGVTARLAEVDPWGGIRVVGVGRPPWAPPANVGSQATVGSQAIVE